MKHTIEGFSQKTLVEYGLDVIDAVILRWITDFYNTGRMKTRKVNGKEYFWINYQTIINDLPILKIDNRRSLARRIDKLVDCGILEKFIDKDQGNLTYFRFVKEKYYQLKRY